MSHTTIPQGYQPLLGLYDTQKAIGLTKRLFEDALSGALNLRRVSAPLFVEAASGLNDNLNGVERPVSFTMKEGGGEIQVVHSLAKWKRLALRDYGLDRESLSDHVADTLLNYAPDHHGFFWWGPYGVSTERTAYDNLKAGLRPPYSGSAACNGPTIAEQIGGQIFIDGWGMLAPGEEALAADLAARAACVTHGDNGVYGGMFIAAAVAAAFDAKDIGEVLRRALAVIPEDWRAYIGDGIKSICLTNGHGPFPQDCTQLTDCLMNLLPVTLRTRHEALIARRVPAVTLGDETIIENVRPEDFYGRDFVQKLSARKPHSYTIEGVYADCLVEFDRMPAIAPGEQLTGRVTLIPHTMPEQKHYRLRFLAPEGWQVDCAKNLFTSAPHSSFRQHASAEFTIHAGEQVEAVNRIVLEIVCAGRPTPLLAPIQIMG